MGIQLIKMDDANWVHRGGPPGLCQVAEATCSPNADSMSGGWAYFDNCKVEWRVRYDEFIFVLDGIFKIYSDGKETLATRGDVVFIKNGTLIEYRGEGATVFYALAPANWKEATGFTSFSEY